MPDPILATVADLGIVVDEQIADDNPKALLLLRTASGIVRSETRQYLSPVDADSIRRTPRGGGREVYLPEMPVRALTSVATRGRDGDYTILDSTSYDLDEETGRIRLWWPSTATSWQIVYDHGFTTIPEPLADLVRDLAARHWETPVAVENERIGNRSIKYLMLENGFMPEEQAVLDRYHWTGIA